MFRFQIADFSPILLALFLLVAAAGADGGTEPSSLQVAPGFAVEQLYEVPKETQGSWVALAHDPQGRLIAGDQYGGLYRITPPAVGSAETVLVEELAVSLIEDEASSDALRGSGRIGAHGLLHAFDSLFVMVCEDRERQGLWRLRDTDGDDQYDEVRYLRRMAGGGEHGPHSLALAPDGQSIYFANGNHTELPDKLDGSLPTLWGEDLLLPRLWDPRGHARARYSPGGYIGRIDPEGRKVELFAIGFRNQFDLAFDPNGELFTYDSDMEWNVGAPWYMPTRINHVVSAGEYGWRSGSGRWPAYYHDSLPSVVDMGPGSPTGVTFGAGARFPARYQNALFAADWTMGALFALHLTPDGATFRAEKETFLQGKPLPLTDVIINPHDGALYFITGGRRNQSALYRVTYIGGDSVEPAVPAPPAPESRIRRTLESLHAFEGKPADIDFIWRHLGHGDRFIRFAARAALERQETELWTERALAEEDTLTAIEALTALARAGSESARDRLVRSLERIDFAVVEAEMQLPLLRTWQLVFTRMGRPAPASCSRIAALLESHFPHRDPLVNRELVALLSYLDSPGIVRKTVPLLAEPEASTTRRGATHPDPQQIAYALALRRVSSGWTPDLRRDYFSWFPKTTAWRGGDSLAGYIEKIRQEALECVEDPEWRAELTALSQPLAHHLVDDAVAPEGPGRNYTLQEATELVSPRLRGRDFARGKAMYASAACIACHKFNDQGSGIGPDLSAAGNRYTVRDLLESIIEPSRVISDQYGTEIFELTDSDAIIGRVVEEGDHHLLVMINPFEPNDPYWLSKRRIKTRQEWQRSMMPPGLINQLGPDELADLVAYLLSGGNAEDPMFQSP